jgi:hypothetical protein
MMWSESEKKIWSRICGLNLSQNYARLNFGSVTAEAAPPQLRMLVFNSSFYPNFVNQSQL